MQPEDQELHDLALDEGDHFGQRAFAFFDIEARASKHCTVVFGHWSTQGLLMRPELLGLDSGCVWGGALSAVRLANRELFQVNCPQAANPAPG